MPPDDRVTPHRVAVIMAGGPGTRLWPLSRRAKPKQLLRLGGKQSLLAQSCERLSGVAPNDQIYVITLAEHLPAIAADLPQLSAANLIGEPMARDTAAAVALSASILHARNPATVMGVFTADHFIRPADRFRLLVSRAYDVVERNPDALITFGVKPTSPHTGMGYLERGTEVEPGVFRVAAFKEKPDAATAQSYVTSGAYFWNSGMFVWRAETILRQLERHLPATHAVARSLAAQWDEPAHRAEREKAYAGLQKISIDHAVMEKAENVLMIEFDAEWIDLGHWTSLPAIIKPDAAGNARAAQNAALLDAAHNIIVCEDDHLIAALGVEDLVIIHSPDATLVCRRDQVDKIKALAARIEREHGDRYS